MVDLLTPEVVVLGETGVNWNGLARFLEVVGAPEWQTDATTGSEIIAEVAGRLCYQSFAVGLNPNVTRVREGNKPYIKNILSSGHGSVLEHGTVNLALLNCTPVLTHELVRHRAGTAFSQISGRYCRIDRLGFYWPEAFKNAQTIGAIESAELAAVEREANAMLIKMEAFQGRLARMFKLDTMADFALKKMLTSAFRRFAPYGMKTGIIVTANHRAIRHIIAIRNDIHAEEEVRLVAFQLGILMKERFPNIYQDMEIESVVQPWGEEEVWRFSHGKV